MQQERLTQLASRARNMLVSLVAGAAVQTKAEYLDKDWPLHKLHRIAGSGKLSQGLTFKRDPVSHCLLKFILEESMTTLSHSESLQGVVEVIVVGRGMMPSALIIPLKLKATYATEDIKGSHPTPSATPCLIFTESWFSRIILMGEWFR